jgi:iron complex outermembrane receptor protein
MGRGSQETWLSTLRIIPFEGKGDKKVGSKKILVALLVAIAFLFWSQMSVAEEVEEEYIVDLGEVVVTPTKIEEEIRKIPANVTVITEEDIASSNAQIVLDLLRTEVGVIVRDWTGSGTTSQVDLRGFGETAGSNTLVLVDGRRVNEIDISGVDWTQIPLDQVERIEVVRGSGSVLYGDNATGGVINIITKVGKGKPSFEVGTSFGSFELDRERASFGGSTKNSSYSLRASHQSTDGYRDNSDFETRDFGAKFSHNFNDRFSLGLSGGYHKADYGLPGALSEDELSSDRRQTRYPDDDADCKDYYLRIEPENAFGNFGNLKTDISFRRRKVDSDFPSMSYIQKSKFDTTGFCPEYILGKAIFGHQNKFIAGIDGYKVRVTIDMASSFLTDKQDIDKDSLGYYLHDSFTLSDKLILTAGYRYERQKFDFHPDKATLDEEASSIGLVYLYKDDSSLFANLAKSFRFPKTDEYFSVFAGFNKDLIPQTADHYELGVRHCFSSSLRTNLTLFSMHIDDEIYYDPITFGNENYDETRHQGVELSIDTKIKKIDVFGNYTYTEATFKGGDYDDNDIPAVPSNKATVGIRFDMREGFKIVVTANYIDKRYFISDQRNQVDRLGDYITTDLKLSYRWKDLVGFVGVNNLFNKGYCEYGALDWTGAKGYYYPSPKRNFVVGFSSKF